jgi:hypothetical protein
MRRVVQWFRNQEVPLLKKIGAVFLAIVPMMLVGPIFGSGAFILAFLALTFLAYRAADEIKTLDYAETKTQNRKALLQRIKQALGGEAAYNAIPVLDLGNRYHLSPQDLGNPIMKGADNDRPFICLKCHDRGHPEAQQVIYLGESIGDWGIISHYADLNTLNANERQFEDFCKIVSGQHNRYILAR